MHVECLMQFNRENFRFKQPSFLMGDFVTVYNTWKKWRWQSKANWSFTFLTGDFAIPQKPLHPCFSQLLVGQTLSGEHDSEWRTIPLSIVYITVICTSPYFCWHAPTASVSECLVWPLFLSWQYIRGRTVQFTLVIEAFHVPCLHPSPIPKLASHF